MGGLRLKFDGQRVLNNGREIKRIGLLAGGTGTHTAHSTISGPKADQ
jgi:hypothetical protein